MKIRHKSNPHWQPPPEPISERYQAEVDAATNRLAERERRALVRLEQAERRLERASRIVGKVARARAVDVANELIEMRRQELLAIQRLMSGAPASAEHRSKKGRHRPPIPMGTI